MIGLLINLDDVPWETLPPRLLSVFDLHRPTLHLVAGFHVDGTGSGDVHVKVTLPDGFDFVAGSAMLEDGDHGAVAAGDPTITGSTLDWDLPGATFGVDSSVAFDVYSGSDLGPQQATEDVTVSGAAASSIKSFSVADAFSNNTVGSAKSITPDQNVEMSGILGSGEVDYYTIPMPDKGTRLLVHLTNLPADYDLALYAPQSTSVRTGATDGLPLQDGTLADQSINLAGGSNAQLTPTALQDVPDTGIPLVTVGDNRGTDDEDVGFVSPGGGGDVTIAVFGYNGASSPKPYSLRVTTQVPPTVTCTPRSFPDAGQGTPGTMPSSFPSDVNTLILVNEKRIGDTYGSGKEASVATALTTLAGQRSLGVSGAVLPVESISGVQAAYDQWDANPCDVGRANVVANLIANEVDSVKATHPSLKYVVFAGGDDQIPFFRVPDLELIANESGFAGQFSDNEYAGALASGDLLSDNPYLDTRPVPASGRQLFIPDLVGGRLVESADDIVSAASQFVSSSGKLDALLGVCLRLRLRHRRQQGRRRQSHLDPRHERRLDAPEPARPDQGRHLV